MFYVCLGIYSFNVILLIDYLDYFFILFLDVGLVLEIVDFFYDQIRNWLVFYLVVVFGGMGLIVFVSVMVFFFYSC